tara:strand:- start:150 stop:815 length:666 start_codon:yes stop_codon:yes gene_type:complete
MAIDNLIPLITGSLVSRGADKLLNPKGKNLNLIDTLTGGGYTGQGTSTKSKTFGGIAKQGIMSLIARSILGPILGPLALTLGTNIFNKNPNITKGLGFFNQDGVPKGPGIPKGPVIDPDTPIDEGFQVTGNYAGNDFYSAEGTTVDSVTGDLTNADGTYGGNIVDEFAQPSPPSNNDSDGDSGSGGGGNMSASDFSDDTAGTPFKYGGRASYSGGGLASLL